MQTEKQPVRMGRYKWRHNLQCRELCTCERLDVRGQPGVVST